jgi:hypothetical protein
MLALQIQLHIYQFKIHASVGNIKLNATKVDVLNDLIVIGSVRSSNFCTYKGSTFN